MTFPYSGQRIETLAIAIAGAQGARFEEMDKPGKDYLRRSANALLYRLGGEGAAKMTGIEHLRDVLAEFSDATDALIGDPSFGRVPEEMRDRIAFAGAQARLAGGALFEGFHADIKATVAEARRPTAEKEAERAAVPPPSSDDDEAV